MLLRLSCGETRTVGSCESPAVTCRVRVCWLLSVCQTPPILAASAPKVSAMRATPSFHCAGRLTGGATSSTYTFRAGVGWEEEGCVSAAAASSVGEANLPDALRAASTTRRTSWRSSSASASGVGIRANSDVGTGEAATLALALLSADCSWLVRAAGRASPSAARVGVVSTGTPAMLRAHLTTLSAFCEVPSAEEPRAAPVAPRPNGPAGGTVKLPGGGETVRAPALGRGPP